MYPTCLDGWNTKKINVTNDVKFWTKQICMHRWNCAVSSPTNSESYHSWICSRGGPRMISEGGSFWSNYNSTIDSCYLKFQGTLWNTSRYPYLDISDFQNWGKIIQTTTFNKYVCNWTLDVRDILKILWKRGEIAPYEQFLHFSTIFFTCC